MRIYEFKYAAGETDWVFAPTMKEAKEFYIQHTGCGDLDDCKVTIIKKKEWDSCYIIDINEPEPDTDECEYNEDDYHNGYKILGTFAEYAENNTITDIIATTEY